MNREATIPQEMVTSQASRFSSQIFSITQYILSTDRSSNPHVCRVSIPDAPHQTLCKCPAKSKLCNPTPTCSPLDSSGNASSTSELETSSNKLKGKPPLPWVCVCFVGSIREWAGDGQGPAPSQRPPPRPLLGMAELGF